MSVPIGTILPFYGGDNQLPNGYFFCDGSKISRTNDPDLYAHLVLANPDLRVDGDRCELPDLRGEFLRGWDNGRQADKDRRLGSNQNDQVVKHSHPDSSISYSTIDKIAPSPGHHWGGGVHSVKNKATKSYGGDETRPRNVAVNFIIKR